MNLREYFHRPKQVELADHLGVSVSLVSMFVAGRRTPTEEQARAIERWTERRCTVGELRPE